MARFPLTQDIGAPSDVKRTYEDFRQKMGLPEVPNFIRTQGVSPSVLAGTCGLVENILLKGCLPRSIKELIFVAVAADRECEYCMDAHTACCRILGVDESTIRAVMEGIAGDIPYHIRDIICFAVKCAASPEELNDEDFASLRGHGLGTEPILEVIATAAMAVYATILADATLLDIDAMFAKI
jgi:uncharacterized peroxidase-related enzyme